jgi:hypothetical protein
MRDETDLPYANLNVIHVRFHPGDELRATGKPRLPGRAVSALPVPAEYAARRFRLHPHLLLSGVDTLNQGYPVVNPRNPDTALLLLINHGLTMVEPAPEGVLGLFIPAPLVHAPAPRVAAPTPLPFVGSEGAVDPPPPAVAGEPTPVQEAQEATPPGTRRRRVALAP